MTTTLQAHAVENFQIIKHFPHIQHFKIPKDLKLSKLYASQCSVFLKTGLVYICLITVELYGTAHNLEVKLPPFHTPPWFPER
jgi:hypothetical protein